MYIITRAPQVRQKELWYLCEKLPIATTSSNSSCCLSRILLYFHHPDHRDHLDHLVNPDHVDIYTTLAKWATTLADEKIYPAEDESSTRIVLFVWYICSQYHGDLRDVQLLVFPKSPISCQLDSWRRAHLRIYCQQEWGRGMLSLTMKDKTKRSGYSWKYWCFREVAKKLILVYKPSASA